MQPGKRVFKNFVVLEGLDGSGTTTQTQLLSKRLAAAGESVLSTCEPSNGAVGVFIRSILRREVSVDPCTLALLFVADRNEHLFSPINGMAKHLDAGGIVVCDRYLFSSLAYQSVGCNFDYVAGLNERFPLPRYLIFLDVPPAECQRRLVARPDVELFEGSEMQQAILQSYERGIERFSEEGMEVVRVDGTAQPEQVAEKIWRSLSALPIQNM